MLLAGTGIFSNRKEFALSNEQLKEAGLKVTLPRLKILGLLEHASDKHLSAEDVYKQLLEAGEDVGLATVYRVLTQFESAGLVSRHNFEDGHAVFELSSDEHHDHMVCVDSGEVLEFVSRLSLSKYKGEFVFSFF